MKTITEIKNEFASASLVEKKALCQLYAEDERSGVRKLIEKCRKEEAALEKELLRMEHMMEYEHKYEHLGYLCGIDEVGRGPLAGPVVACAVILPKDHGILYLNDSKKLTAKKREELYEVILEKAVSVGIGMAGPARIDEINILQATYEAMREAVRALGVVPDVLLNDAVRIPGLDVRQWKSPRFPLSREMPKALPLPRPALWQRLQGTGLWKSMMRLCRNTDLLPIRDMVLRSI